MLTRRLAKRVRRNAKRKEKKNLQMPPLKIAQMGTKKTLKMWRGNHSGFIRQ